MPFLVLVGAFPHYFSLFVTVDLLFSFPGFSETVYGMKPRLLLRQESVFGTAQRRPLSVGTVLAGAFQHVNQHRNERKSEGMPFVPLVR